MNRFTNLKMLIKRKLRQLLFGCRRSSVLCPLLAWVALMTLAARLSQSVTRALLPPSEPDVYKHDLSHFRRSRSLKHYLDNIQLLIEPSTLNCSRHQQLIAMVSSESSRQDHRDAIRRTWGPYLPTYFVMGVLSNDQLINIHAEAKSHGDLVVFDFKDRYQNLTLKTGLMLRWVQMRCPQITVCFKVDDDILVNPWTLRQLLKDWEGSFRMLGFLWNNTPPYRGQMSKYYLPRWLFYEDVIPQYVSGPGYLISGNFIEDLLTTAYKVPMHNIEDVYFSYNVAKKTLGYELSHTSRFALKSPFPCRTWLPFGCVMWDYALLHTLTPRQLLRMWPYILRLGKRHVKGEVVCQSYSEMILY